MTDTGSGIGEEEVQPETDGFGGIVKTAEEVERENQPQTPEEELESFAAGFDRVKKSTPDELGPDAKTEETGEIGSTTGDQTQSEADTEKQELARKIRRLEGQIGTLLDDRKKKPEGESTAETQQAISEIRAELNNLKAIDASVGEFGELEPFKQELLDQARKVAELEQRLATTGTGGIDPEMLAAIVDQKVLDVTRPGWKATTSTPEFLRFMLQGGPSEAEYTEYARFNNDKTPESQAEAEKFLADWEKDLPGWWGDRGKDLFRGGVQESVSIIDRYEDSVRAVSQRREQQVNRSQNRAARLRSSATPGTVSGDPVIGLSDNEAFERGFKKQRGR